MMRIRSMCTEDVAQVARIEEQNFSKPWSKQGFYDALALDSSVFLTAEEEGKIIGYIGMAVALDEGEITQVVVAEAYRCCGIGEQLIDAIKQEAKRREISSLVLEVRVSNAPAIHLYEKKGFKNQGIRKGFYDAPKEDAYIYVMKEL
jgi:ribosomal-protein-alanine N-acetyltransferase